MTRIALLYSRMRPEENLLVAAGEALGIEIVPVWDGQLVLSVHDVPDVLRDVDAVVVRTLSLHRALAVSAALEAHDIACLNRHEVIATCGDKWVTSLALARSRVPTPRTLLATGPEAALNGGEAIGYPLVTKPLSGSWARMVARLSDADALEAIVESREVLGHAGHHLHYLQEHVDKPGRDIRAFVVGDEVIAAIYRTSPHWITNTARGARATNCPLTDELTTISARAARAVGGGALAVDLMETPSGLVVHEVNATMEFRNSVEPTGVDIPRRIVEHAARQAAVVA